MSCAADAAELARSNGADGIAQQLVGVTTKGEACGDFVSCKALIDAGSDIDYDGQSGPLELDDGGEPTVARFTVVAFGADNYIDWDGASEVTSGDAARAGATTPTAPARDATVTGGALRIGALLPQTGGLDFLGVTALAAAELAVADINAAGGVNGVPVELVSADEGDYEDELVIESAALLIADDVDVVLGAIATGQTLRVIDDVVGAGIVMISPSNTGSALSDYSDNGLYFRTVPPDSMQARAVAELVAGAGHLTVALIANDDVYGMSLVGDIGSELSALGFVAESVTTSVYPLDALDEAALDALVEVMITANPDALVLIGFDETAEIIVRFAARGFVPKRP